jgi:SH3-like domain-containing protein
MRLWLLPLAFICLVAHSEPVCVRAPWTALRKGPGPKYDKSWTVPKYMPFLKLERKGEWLKLSDLDGEIHWGHIMDFTENFHCVVVKTNTAETRQGPGTKYPYGDYKSLDRFTPLKRLDVKDNWVQVESDTGMKFWVQESKVWRPVQIQTIHF